VWQLWQQYTQTGIRPKQWTRQTLSHLRKKFGVEATTEEGRSGGVVESVDCPVCGAVMTTWHRNAVDQMLGTINWDCPSGHVINTYPDGKYYSDWGQSPNG